jgi:uncharacterized protein (TIGR02453 family)
MPSYFTRHTFKFLRELARNNTRDWFHANKARYEEHLRDPYLRLIGDLQAPLARTSRHYRADPRPVGGSLFRIHRDTRFASDKRPYKEWAGARFFHERARQVEAPSFYVHLQPNNCFVGAGLWHPQPETVRRVREFLVGNPAAWIKATRSKAFRSRFELGGESLSRVPRGFAPEHPLIDDIKRKDFTAWATFDEDTACGPRLREHVAQRFRGLAPMVDYLCAALDLEF